MCASTGNVETAPLIAMRGSILKRIPDCDDYDAASWMERGVESLDFSANGSGVLAAEALPEWWDAFNSTESINSRIRAP